ncbi:hypothetical protein K1T71_006550 [Dendrolimus kikuchii]|uniref:Uncharacterized protein n=1 Tax=Dendrolimus kikuchii TaxID=765133 RepID=A0ACC1D1G7_9NEOP|nr:hypothetical protein K1T71_006550 [Dendrolimus kikuchii]
MGIHFTKGPPGISKLSEFIIHVLRFFVLKDIKEKASQMQFCQKSNGKEIAMYNGYTFYCHKQFWKTTIWSCTVGSSCKARLITTNEVNGQARVIKDAKTDHNHLRPAYMIDNKGYYVRL